MNTFHCLTTVLLAGALLAPGLAAQKDAKIRSGLVSYLKADKEARVKMLKKEIKDLGDPAVPILQATMDVLLPCYRKADKALKRAKRRKQEVEQLDEKKVAAMVIAVVGKGEAPSAELSKANAFKGLRAMISPLAMARSSLVQPQLVEFFKEQGKLGVSYPGQYAPLKKRFGRAAMAVLLNMVMHSQATEGMRAVALVALRDVAEKDDPVVLRNLRKFVEDEFQSKPMRQRAAISQALLGDDSGMEPFFAEKTRLTKKTNPKAQARGWQGLGDLWHKLGEHKQAVTNYTKLIEIMKKLVEDKKRLPQDLAAAYSSRACSHSMAGMVEEGVGDVKEAIKLGGVRRKSLENDKELDNLRKHPEWEKVVESAPEKIKKPKY